MEETPEFCGHNFSPSQSTRIVDGILVHIDCGLPVECEFGDEPHAATGVHIDYVCCDAHRAQAVDNVHGRTLPNSV